MLAQETVIEVTWVIPRLQGYEVTSRICYELLADIFSSTPFFGYIIGKRSRVAVVVQYLIIWISNIDRIFAIYQALYPDKWVPASGRLNSSTKLYPFRKDANEFWNSNDVKDWRTLGYAIPGNQRLTKESTAILETHLHEYYNW